VYWKYIADSQDMRLKFERFYVHILPLEPSLF